MSRKSKKIKGGGEKRNPSLFIPILFVFLLVGLLAFDQNNIIVKKFLGISTEKVKVLPSINPTASFTPATSPSPSPALQTTTYTNPDPIVACRSTHPNCYGSTINLPRSQCSHIYCCGIGNNWSLFPSVEKCKEAAASTSQQTTQNNHPTTPIQGNNFYCWDNAYGYAYYTSSGDQCNLDNAKSTTYEICMTTQKIKSDTCKSVCQSVSDQGKQSCSGLSSYPVDYYGDCLNGPGGVGDQYAACLGKCTDQYGQDIQQCH